METVLAVGLVAVTVPILFGALAAAHQLRRHAEEDTLACGLARRVHDELRLAWSGQASWFRDEVPAFPSFGGELGGIGLLFDNDGAFVRRTTAAEITGGIRDAQAGYLVTVEGTPHQSPGMTCQDPLSKVRVVVGSPARAPRSRRSCCAFTTLCRKEGPP